MTSTISQTYTASTRDIRISVVPQFLPEQSDVVQKLYGFSYTIIIENFGQEPVQLLRRHWYVYSGEELLTEVEGEGVVGETPALEPGESFQYTSGTMIHDPIGMMKGSYTFRTQQGTKFLVNIPSFDLVCREELH
jgi:ApaG protein